MDLPCFLSTTGDSGGARIRGLLAASTFAGTAAFTLDFLAAAGAGEGDSAGARIIGLLAAFDCCFFSASGFFCSFLAFASTCFESEFFTFLTLAATATAASSGSFLVFSCLPFFLATPSMMLLLVRDFACGF